MQHIWPISITAVCHHLWTSLKGSKACLSKRVCRSRKIEHPNWIIAVYQRTNNNFEGNALHIQANTMESPNFPIAVPMPATSVASAFIQQEPTKRAWTREGEGNFMTRDDELDKFLFELEVFTFRLSDRYLVEQEKGEGNLLKSMNKRRGRECYDPRWWAG